VDDDVDDVDGCFVLCFLSRVLYKLLMLLLITVCNDHL